MEAFGLLLPDHSPALARALHLPAMHRWGPAFAPLFLAVLAHHGRPIFPEAPRDRQIWKPFEAYDPHAAAEDIGAFLLNYFVDAWRDGPNLPECQAFQHHLAGLVALADQIGSMEAHFPLGRHVHDALMADSAARAQRAIAALRLDGSGIRAGLRNIDAATAFGWPQGSAPKPMQQRLRDLPVDARLVVLESETGSGKTEAAILRFQRLFAAGEVDSMYFAVPTRAAASALHARIDRAIRAMTAEEAVLAVPGYLRAGAASGRALPGFEVLWDDAPEEALRMARWAAETPRRFLASFVAVGTVDQVMLAGLRVKWAHFRTAALSRALLVIDEVHASERYMQAVLDGVLRTHLAGGGHALLMSATLGADARAKWLVGPRGKPDRAVAYPALSWREGKQERHLPLQHDGRSKTVAVSAQPVMAVTDAVARLAIDAAARGARVLVIRNTVNQVIATQQAIEALMPNAPLLHVNGVPAPHHGRFAAEDRLLLDQAVEAGFGKHAPLAPIIAVGSQTLEQSLDICADILISDLCPIDVLLQRIGRLHRHDRPRATGFETAPCVVLAPEALEPGAGLVRFGLGHHDGRGVYPDMTGLEAVRRLIAERPVWTIPRDNRDLVEAGTDPQALDALAARLGHGWTQDRLGLSGTNIAKDQHGRSVSIDRTIPFDNPQILFPDDEKILTRLGSDRFMVELGGAIGPFGHPVSRMTLPEHLMRAADPAEQPQVEQVEDGLLLRWGAHAIRYTRLGAIITQS